MSRASLKYSKRSVAVHPERSLIAHFWMPSSTPERLVVLQHGFGDHSLRYGNVIDALDNKRTAFAALDAIGHGQSPGARGHVEHLRVYSQDLERFLDLILAEEFKDVDVFLFGHSLGGVIVTELLQQYVSKARISKAILSSPAFSVVMDVPKQVKAFFARRLAHVLPALSVNAGSMEKFISRDPDVVRQYSLDPLCHNMVSFSMAVTLLDVKERVFPTIDQIETPILITHGTADRICHYQGSQEFFDLLPHTQKEIRLLDGYFHETFNEPKGLKEEVLGLYSDFLASDYVFKSGDTERKVS